MGFKESFAIYLRKSLKASLFYGLSLCISSLFLIAILHKQGFQLSVLPFYDQDNLLQAALTKTLIKSGFSLINTQIGAPAFFDYKDYPMSESASLVILKLLSFISANYVIVFNLFFILSFLLTTLTSLFVFRYLGLDKPFALGASLLFTFLPYSFLRAEMGHFFLCTYYVVPIYVLLIFSVLRQPQSSRSIHPGLYMVFAALACLFAASSGVYYAFFAAYLLLFAGVVTSIEKKQWKPLGKAAILASLISLTLVLNMLPAIYTKSERGTNDEMIHRTSEEAELYGLKITQLLLPTDRHRVQTLANFKDYYNSTAPLSNENRSATLGIIGSIGFLLLLLILLVRKFPYTSETLLDLSRLNIAAVLLGTVGGLGSVFSYLVSPMIRGYNRISVFIAFFSLAAFFLLLQAILKKKASPLLINKLSWALIIFLVIPGIVDQMPHMGFSRDQALFASDASFVAKIEKAMPAGAMVMQLPFVKFPESLPSEGMYSLFRGYLHSNQLRWSYGSMRGQGVSLWQEQVANEPVDKMLADVAYAGFTGLYIYRQGFATQRKDIEKQINAVLHTGPLLVSAEQDLAFYDLRPYIHKMQMSMPNAAWQAHVKQVYREIAWLDNFHLFWNKGFYTLEKNTQSSWHWSQRKSKLTIYNHFDHDIKMQLDCRIVTGYPEYNTVWIDSDLIKEALAVNRAGLNLHRELIIPPGTHDIRFKTDANRIAAVGDYRQLYFSIYDFSLIRSTT
jgi:phosphoglycerol transferase